MIFIDGTWRQACHSSHSSALGEAKSMVQRSDWLREHVPRAVIRQLGKVLTGHVRPSAYSGYRFRKQPALRLPEGIVMW